MQGRPHNVENVPPDRDEEDSSQEAKRPRKRRGSQATSPTRTGRAPHLTLRTRRLEMPDQMD
jgi:hypothetical protein